MIINSLFLTAGYLFLTLAIPLVVVLGLTFINRDSKYLLASTFGSASQIYAGGVGIMVHETSHLIMALIFGHRIDDCKLLILPWNVERNGGALGYVNHSWNDHSLYQSLGNVLIGTAPIYGCTAVLILLTRWLVPGVYIFGQQVEKQLANGVSINTLLTALNQLGTSQAQSTTSLILWILLSINICLGGFDLSPADLKGSFAAFIESYLIIACLLFILIYCGFESAVHNYLIMLITWFVLVMVISFIWSILANLLCRIGRLIF